MFLCILDYAILSCLCLYIAIDYIYGRICQITRETFVCVQNRDVLKKSSINTISMFKKPQSIGGYTICSKIGFGVSS